MLQRRVAGAEVVQRYRDPHPVQPRDRLQHPVRVGHQRALGDLQLKEVGRYAVRVKELVDPLRDLAGVQVPHADVDRRPQPSSRLPPARQLDRHVLQDPLGEQPHRRRRLGHPDQLLRADHPAVRVPPPQQRLHPDDLTGGDGDLRLVEERYPVVRRAFPQRTPQIPEQRQPVRGVVGGVRPVHRDLIAALLGVVHGRLGLPQQRLTVAAGFVAQGDPDRGAHVDRHAIQRERPVQRLGQMIRQPARRHGPVHPGSQHRELVTTQPDHQVMRRHHLRQPVSDLDQQPVAHRVPERVVHRTEAVEIEQQKRKPSALVHRRQRPSIGQPGERVHPGGALGLPRGPDHPMNRMQRQQHERHEREPDLRRGQHDRPEEQQRPRGQDLHPASPPLSAWRRQNPLRQGGKTVAGQDPGAGRSHREQRVLPAGPGPDTQRDKPRDGRGRPQRDGVLNAEVQRPPNGMPEPNPRHGDGQRLHRERGPEAPGQPDAEGEADGRQHDGAAAAVGDHVGAGVDDDRQDAHEPVGRGKFLEGVLLEEPEPAVDEERENCGEENGPPSGRALDLVFPVPPWTAVPRSISWPPPVAAPRSFAFGGRAGPLPPGWPLAPRRRRPLAPRRRRPLAPRSGRFLAPRPRCPLAPRGFLRLQAPLTPRPAAAFALSVRRPLAVPMVATGMPIASAQLCGDVRLAALVGTGGPVAPRGVARACGVHATSTMASINRSFSR